MRFYSSFLAFTALLCPTAALAAFSMFQAGGGVIPPPPVVSSVVATPSSTTAAVTWTTSTPSNSKVNYATAANYAIHGYDTLQSDPSLVTSHSINLASLTASITYHFDVCSTDAYAQPACSPDSTFTTTSGASIPTITAGTAQPGNTITAGDASHASFSTWAPLSTALLGQQGSAGLGFADNAIAVWDFPHYSLQSGTITLRVIGYHSSGTPAAPLAKVAFFLDNGPEVDVAASNCTHFGAAEYCVQVNDAALADGPHEVRAIAYPVRGYPRALESVSFATTTAGAKINHQAHGFQSAKIVRVTGSTDATLVNGLYCVMLNSDLDPSHYDLAPFTGGPYPQNGNQGSGSCGASATSAMTGGSTITISKERAGLNEVQAAAGGSLFFQTNHNGTLFPSATSTVFVDSVSGNNANSCTASGSACADISHAVAKMVPANDGATWTSNGTATISNAANAYALNQAVTVSGTLPSPLQAGRPYWVVNSVPNTSIQLSLVPSNGAGGIVVSPAAGSFTIKADYSNFTTTLECSGPCASPSNYAVTGVTKPASYGWFNLIPLAGTAHANTVLTSGSLAIADKVHLMVDVKDALTNGASYNYNQWGLGNNDTWGDTMTYTGACQSCGLLASGDSWLGILTGAWYGFIQFTSVTAQNLTTVAMSSGSVTTVVGSTAANTNSGGFEGPRSLMLGTTHLHVGTHMNVAPPLVSEAGWNTVSPTLTYANGALPANLITAAVSNWGVAALFGQPTSGCISAGGNNITAVTHSPDVLTLSGATAGNCAAGQFITISTYSHPHGISIFDQQLYGNYSYGGVTNLVFGYNTCTDCYGGAILVQHNGAGTAASQLDVAYIGNNWASFQGLQGACTTAPDNTDTCMWTTAATLSLTSPIVNFLVAGNTFPFIGPSVNSFGASMSSTGGATDAVWASSNSCTGYPAGAGVPPASVGLGGVAGWTYQPGGGC